MRWNLSEEECGRSIGDGLELADVILDRLDAHFVGDDQAFEMLAAVDETLGEDRAVLVHQDGIGQLGDFVGLADFGTVDELIAAEAVLGDHLALGGGIVIAAGRLDEVVPIEPATMVDRRIVQWDKDDCADMGIIKIDLLGLGMLAALEETIHLIKRHEGKQVDLAMILLDARGDYCEE